MLQFLCTDGYLGKLHTKLVITLFGVKNPFIFSFTKSLILYFCTNLDQFSLKSSKKEEKKGKNDHFLLQKACHARSRNDSNAFWSTPFFPLFFLFFARF